MKNLADTLNNIDAKMDELDCLLVHGNANAAMMLSVEMRILLASAMDQVSRSNDQETK